MKLRLDPVAQRIAGGLLMPVSAEAHNNLAVALAARGKIAAAAGHFERAVQLKPGSPEAHCNLANCLAAAGKMQKALVHYGRAIALRPDFAEAHFNRSEIRTFHAGDAELAALEALAKRDDLPEGKRPYVHFALGKAYEDTGDFERAFIHWRIGNEVKRSQIHYDETSAAQLFRSTAAVFGGRAFEGAPAALSSDELTPIFIVGMPRSGSTVIEQILAGHPEVHAAGETRALEEAIGSVADAGRITAADRPALRRIGQAYLELMKPAAGGKRFMVDKMPGNFIYAGLIRLALPNARIIHSMREPLDTCVSCYSKLFAASQSFSYDLGELGRHYRRYWEMMAHWRAVLPAGSMLEVPYESVVANVEVQARRIIQFCGQYRGLGWHEGCVRFQNGARPVLTASVAQVRRPLYQSSLGRWRRYEAHLEPLLRELGEGRAREKSSSAKAGG